MLGYRVLDSGIAAAIDHNSSKEASATVVSAERVDRSDGSRHIKHAL